MIMLRIANIKIPVNASDDALLLNILKILKVKGINGFKISKKSIDARKKTNIVYVFSVDVDVDNEDKVLLNLKNADVTKITEQKYTFPVSKKLNRNPIIIGSGPAGLFAGLVLAQNGYNPIVLERGGDVDSRSKKVTAFWNGSSLDTETNVQFGEGGAGTFSDGKLTTGIKDFRIRKVLEEFVRFGAPEEIMYLSKPHIGTDILKTVVKGIRNEIIRLGGEVRFFSKAEKLLISNNKLHGILVTSQNGTYELPADNVILATGHSARDTFFMLNGIGMKMEAKPFSVGMRIEHPQSMINNAQYGEFSKYLPAADYKLSVHLPNGRGVYSFCMCPGGFVVNASSEENGLVTNGMSNFARNERNANSAILVSVTPDDFDNNSPLSGIDFQRKIEKAAFIVGGSDYNMPVQTVGGFLNNKIDTELKDVYPSIKPRFTFSDMSEIFPEFVISSVKEALYCFDKKIPGFASADAVLTAPETRSSSPVRIIRNEFHETSVSGVYTAGEGGGHAGGIISSAVDGIKTAEYMLKERNL